MNDPGEESVVCPYNQAHLLLKSRLQFHLAKCRRDYPHMEKATCPFNSTHIVNKIELKNHEENCPDRGVVDNFLYQMSNDSTAPVGLLPVQTFQVSSANNDDNWDEDPVPNAPSVLHQVADLARTKGVLIPMIGAPKAERKAHRYNERLRHAAINDPDHQASQQYRATPAPAAAPAPLAAQAQQGAEEPKKFDYAPPHMPEPKFAHNAPQASSSQSAAPLTSNPWSGGRSNAPQVSNPHEFPTLGSKGSRRDNETGLQDQLNNMTLDSDRNERPNVWGKPAPRQQYARISVPADGFGGGGNRSHSNPWGNRTQQPARPAQSGTAGPADSADPESRPVRMPPVITSDDFPTLVMGGHGRGRRIRN